MKPQSSISVTYIHVPSINSCRFLLGDAIRDSNPRLPRSVVGTPSPKVIFTAARFESFSKSDSRHPSVFWGRACHLLDIDEASTKWHFRNFVVCLHSPSKIHTGSLVNEGYTNTNTNRRFTTYIHRYCCNSLSLTHNLF
jgi:hypothetical protein